ncbi:ABC transporter permease [Streptomyces sp. NPDC094438]|uniref:ABC transporter permease n=1 Tax=Streptomyces sp. NPDC094438 TaxID=3366061 RepID=UPI0038095D0E
MMLRYALQTMRDRRGGFLGAFVALMCAAALITACGTLLETGLRGKIATERYAATPLIVSADQNVHETTVTEKKGKTKVKHKAKPVAERAWLPEQILRTVREVPGVRAVIPELTFEAQALIPAGAGGGGAPRASYGHSWESAPLTPFSLTQGQAPKNTGDLVIDQALAARAHLAPGDRLTVQSTQAPRTYTITGIATPAGGRLVQQTALFFSPAEATRLADRPGQVSAIGIVPDKGVQEGRLADSLRKALAGTAEVSGGDERGPVEFLDAAGARAKLVSMGGAIGGTSLLVAILVVVGTFSLSIQQRHCELALLRAIAATPKQVRKLIGREALLVGVVAGALGSLAGLPLGAWLHGRFVEMGAIPASLERSVSVFPMFAAVAATLFGAWGAARISARRISRIRPAEAMAPDVTRGSIQRFIADNSAGRNAVAVSELTAGQLGLHLGSTLLLTLGDGTPAAFTVAAVYARGLGFGDLTLPHDLLARHMDNPLASAVLVTTDKGARSAGTPGKSITKSELVGLVREFPGVSVATLSSVDKVRADAQRSSAAVNYLAMGLVLAFTAIAVVNTLAMSVSERFRWFAMLRLAGATRRQVLRMLRIEALSVLLIAAVLGSGISLAVLTAFSVGMTGSATPAVLPLVYTALVGAAGLLALVATALPGRMALKLSPVEVATAKQ